MWFLRMCHHISNAVYRSFLEFGVSVFLLYVDSVGSVYKVSDIIADFQQKMLECVWYLERMIYRRVFEKVLERKPERRRTRMGRPRLKWVDDIEENLCKLPTWHTILFHICLFLFSTCFGQSCAHHQENKYGTYVGDTSTENMKCLAINLALCYSNGKGKGMMTVWCAGLDKTHPNLHTKRSSIQSDINEMSYWYN